MLAGGGCVDQCVGVELCSAAGPAEAGASGSVVRLLLQCHNLTQPPPTTRSRYCTTLHCGLLGPGRAEAAADYARSNLALVVVTGQQEVERPAAVPWWERLGTAGGLLALTLGFSVLSLLEILHHCLGFVATLWQEKQK